MEHVAFAQPIRPGQTVEGQGRGRSDGVHPFSDNSPPLLLGVSSQVPTSSPLHSLARPPPCKGCGCWALLLHPQASATPWGTCPHLHPRAAPRAQTLPCRALKEFLLCRNEEGWSTPCHVGTDSCSQGPGAGGSVGEAGMRDERPAPMGMARGNPPPSRERKAQTRARPRAGDPWPQLHAPAAAQRVA